MGVLPAPAFEGRVVDARSGAPLVDTEVVILGLTGSVRTDADGRFTWRPDPVPPFEVLVILSGGQVTRPVLIETIDWAATLTIEISPVIDEQITVTAGAAPSIDATPAAGTTLVTGRELSRRSPTNLMQTLESVPGVNQASEGHAAVPVVRGLAGRRTIILLDGGRVTTERRAGPVHPVRGSEQHLQRRRRQRSGLGRLRVGCFRRHHLHPHTTTRPGQSPSTSLRLAHLNSGATWRSPKEFASGGVVFQAHWRNAEDYRGSGGETVQFGLGRPRLSRTNREPAETRNMGGRLAERFCP